MSKNIYWGGGTSRKVKRVYLGINGVSHKVKKGYIGDDTGKARLFYSSGRVWKKYTLAIQYNWNKYNLATVEDVVEGSRHYKIARGYYGDWYLFTGTTYTFKDGLYYLSSYRLIEGPGRYNPGDQWASSRYGLSDGYAYAVKTSEGTNSGSPWMVETENRSGEEDSYFAIGEASSGGVWDINAGFYYLKENRFGDIRYPFHTTTQGQGSLVGTVASKQQNAYPQNGQSGRYWYVYRNSVNVQGSYVADVEADPGTYPSNGEHSDGYWYVLQPE